MFEYQDMFTGYTVHMYTHGPERNAKLYFTSENFSADDRFFYFNKEETGEGYGGTYRCDWRTGTVERVVDSSYSGFALDREKNIAYVCRHDTEVYAVHLEDNRMEKLGNLPAGGRVTGHLTAADTGRIACSYHLANKIYALCTLDPGKTEADIVYQSDYRLGHAQICPTDENLIFYIHETEGDAFQRTWMCDVRERYVRPYYVEHPNEWITHEVWSADGQEMAFMKLRGKIMIGDKDGHHFDQVAESEQLLHPCLSRDRRWICADRISYLGVDVQEGVVLIERETGKQRLIATTGTCKTGADHQHPSFNREGNMILFSNPNENGIAQVCTIDLGQVLADW